MEEVNLGNTLGEGPKPGRRQVRLYELSGDHYELGYQQGLQAREAVRHFMENLTHMEVFRVIKPPIVPSRLYIMRAAKEAMRGMWEDLSTRYPRQKARVEGIAKGADVDEALLFLIMTWEQLLGRINYRLGACTTVGVTAERSGQGETVIIKNMDHPFSLQPYYITRLCRAENGYSTIGVTLAPMGGCFDGMNEHGLCICSNYGYGTDMPKSQVPVSILVQEALENCTLTREAVSFLRENPRSGGSVVLVADAEGDMASVELSPNFSGVRRPEEGVLINTNHYRCPEMVSYDIPRNAYYTSRNVQALRGIRVHESSELRYARAHQLLAGAERIGVRHLLNVFSDHGESGRGDDNTICRHGEYYSTTCSMIVFPRSRRFLVTYGHPCESVFTDFPDPFGGGEESGEEVEESRGEEGPAAEP
jgi:hypothetical protein